MLVGAKTAPPSFVWLCTVSHGDRTFLESIYLFRNIENNKIVYIYIYIWWRYFFHCQVLELGFWAALCPEHDSKRVLAGLLKSVPCFCIVLLLSACKLLHMAYACAFLDAFDKVQTIWIFEMTKWNKKKWELIIINRSLTMWLWTFFLLYYYIIITIISCWKRFTTWLYVLTPSFILLFKYGKCNQ